MKSITLDHIKDVVIKEEKGNRAVFEIVGLYPGFGVTLGNALRRVLYSSIPGAAITSVKIKGASHEFSTLPGVLEDVLEITLNIKAIAVRLYGEESQMATLKVKGQKEVTAKDIETPSQIEVLNKDAPIATLTEKGSSLEMEFTVEAGMGYQSVEDRGGEKADIGTLHLDAIYTPVKKVNFTVQDMRVGDKTDYNRLTVDVETDGTVTPRDALLQAMDVIIAHFEVIKNSISPTEESAPKGEGGKDLAKVSIADLGLSSRTQNILEENSIKTVGGLGRKSRDDLLALEGMGDRAVDEVEKALKKEGGGLKKEKE